MTEEPDRQFHTLRFRQCMSMANVAASVEVQHVHRQLARLHAERARALGNAWGALLRSA
ncbi:MAG: hypothetical protein ACOY5R_22225 [Pseudomonadota bacterium]